MSSSWVPWSFDSCAPTEPWVVLRPSSSLEVVERLVLSLDASASEVAREFLRAAVEVVEIKSEASREPIVDAWI